MDRMGRLKATKPLFADFTWGAGGSTAELTLELTERTKKDHGLVPNMHLTCTNMPLSKVDDALAACKVRMPSLLLDSCSEETVAGIKFTQFSYIVSPSPLLLIDGITHLYHGLTRRMASGTSLRCEGTRPWARRRGRRPMAALLVPLTW